MTDETVPVRRSTSKLNEILNAAARARTIGNAHKGHRNVGYRAVATLVNACLTGCMIAYEVALPQTSLLIICEAFSAMTLWYQWLHGRPVMFLLRGSSSFIQACIILHASICGRRWLGEDCVDEAWADSRQALRILSVLASLRQVANGMSLFFHWRFPHRMLAGHGNEQLFYRGCIQLTGVPINLLAGILKVSHFHDRLPVEIVVNFCRACGPVLASSITLFNQWWYTSKGHTGHSVADAWERQMDPSIDCRHERVRVTIVSAHGLRKADWFGKSDPYCICSVEGRPESTWHTTVKEKTCDPVWDEVQELKSYRKHDSLVFRIYDYDPPCCSIFERMKKKDDFLGTATMVWTTFDPNGFDGELVIQEAGKGIFATLKIVVELLDQQGNPTGNASPVCVVPTVETSERSCQKNMHEQPACPPKATTRLRSAEDDVSMWSKLCECFGVPFSANRSYQLKPPKC